MEDNNIATLSTGCERSCSLQGLNGIFNKLTSVFRARKDGSVERFGSSVAYMSYLDIITVRTTKMTYTIPPSVKSSLGRMSLPCASFSGEMSKVAKTAEMTVKRSCLEEARPGQILRPPMGFESESDRVK